MMSTNGSTYENGSFLNAFSSSFSQTSTKIWRFFRAVFFTPSLSSTGI